MSGRPIFCESVQPDGKTSTAPVSTCSSPRFSRRHTSSCRSRPTVPNGSSRTTGTTTPSGRRTASAPTAKSARRASVSSVKIKDFPGRLRRLRQLRHDLAPPLRKVPLAERHLPGIDLVDPEPVVRPDGPHPGQPPERRIAPRRVEKPLLKDHLVHAPSYRPPRTG